jgi:hypothetical protein
MGTGGMVLGLIALLFAFVPLVGIFIVIPTGITGVVFSALGIARASKGVATNKPVAIAGLAMAIVALGLLFLGGGTFW